jgi:hypothetical protein
VCVCARARVCVKKRQNLSFCVYVCECDVRVKSNQNCSKNKFRTSEFLDFIHRPVF